MEAKKAEKLEEERKKAEEKIDQSDQVAEKKDDGDSPPAATEQASRIILFSTFFPLLSRFEL